MGFIDDIINPPKPKIDEKELERVERTKLGGLSKEQKADVDQVLRPHLDSSSSNPRERGIDKQELGEALDYLQKNKGKKETHYMDDKDIAEVKKAFEDKL